MKVPINEYDCIDLEAPTLTAEEIVLKPLKRV